YTVAGEISAIAAADLNQDGQPDLVVTTGEPASLVVLLGKGDGTFGASVIYSNSLLDTYGSQLAIADFNGDGKLDLALTNSSANEIDVLSGNGDGTFVSPPQVYSGGEGAGAIGVLDANGDGRPDIAVVGGAFLTVMINRGDGSFPRATLYPVPPLALRADNGRL
ncbi:MAG: FG-GAP repeat domain-containing protein, partial [Gemmataceae bacterium]